MKINTEQEESSLRYRINHEEESVNLKKVT